MTRVWVTRDEPRAGPLATALEAAGLAPVSEPVLETHPVGDARAEIAALGPDDWLVLTSPRAIEAVAQPEARVPRVAVVGEASAQLARDTGLRVAFVSPSGDARGLWRHIEEHGAGLRVCFPRSSRSAPPTLRQARLTAPVLYEVHDRSFDITVAESVAVVTFASPSAVQSVAKRLGRLPIPAASIGPTTSAAVTQAGGRVFVESPERDFNSLARALAASLSQSGRDADRGSAEHAPG